MATDATGTPTALGIPKINTSVDAPSGLGTNAAMDSIDALLQARVTIPASLASQEVPVWNGSAFVRSSVTNIGPTSLGSGTPDATKYLRGDGSWQVPASSGMSLLYDSVDSAVSLPAANIGFSGIAGTYKSLVIDYSIMSTTTWPGQLWLRFNADTGPNYAYVSTGIASSGVGTGTVNDPDGAMIIQRIGAKTYTNLPSTGRIIIPHYSNTTTWKTANWQGQEDFDSTAANHMTIIGSGHWKNTAAVTQVTLYPSASTFLAGSRVSIYGQS